MKDDDKKQFFRAFCRIYFIERGITYRKGVNEPI